MIHCRSLWSPWTRGEPFVAYVKTVEPKWTPYAAENFKGFEEEWKKRALEPKKVVSLLEAYLKKWSGEDLATVVGHNVGFDMAFLRKLAFLSGREDVAGLSHRAIDTHARHGTFPPGISSTRASSLRQSIPPGGSAGPALGHGARKDSLPLMEAGIPGA